MGMVREALWVGVVVLAGCVQTVANPEGPRDAGLDAYDSSVELDAESGAEAGRDGAACECDDPRRPVCLPGKGECVECIEGAGHCPAERPVCGPENACVECTDRDVSACPAGRSVCLADGDVCVECNEAVDCAEDRPACTALHSCAPCAADADCKRFGKVCDEAAGRCVACTLDSEAAQCGGKSCDPATRECTETELGSVTQCKACVADSECQPDHRCIEMFFGTGARKEALGGYCMRRLAAGCAAPYGSAPIRRASISGAPVEDYCGISEVRTSCDAVLDLLRGKPCAGGQDSACGAPGGLCRRVNGIADRCTYACAGGTECPDFAGCADNGRDNYCGKT